MTTESTTARFSHDCEKCVFLGHHENHDLYICTRPGPLGLSVLARFANDGPDYHSAPMKLVTEQHGILWKAKVAAFTRGICWDGPR